MKKFVEVNCPICNTYNASSIYSRTYYAGIIIGKDNFVNVICSGCGLMYMNPKLSEKMLIDHYQHEGSGNIFHEKKQGTRYDILVKERINFVTKYINKDKPGQLLDIGSGQGDFLSSLNIPAWSKEGIEPSPSKDRYSDPSIILYDSTFEVFESNHKFDIITIFGTLEHVYNLPLTLKKMYSLLQDDGYLFISVPDTSKPKPQIAEFFSFEHLYHFTKDTLNKLLKQNNLQILEFDDEVSNEALRCVANKSDKNRLVDNKIDPVNLEKIVNTYKSNRASIEKDIFNKIEPVVRNKKCKIAIYGAGFHTHFLLDSFNLENNVKYIFDSDPEKWEKGFRQWIVLSPQEISKLNADVIIISSKVYEKEIFQTIQKYNTQNIRVIQLYNS